MDQSSTDLTEFKQAVSDLLAEAVKEEHAVEDLAEAVAKLVPPTPTQDPVSKAVVDALSSTGLVTVFGTDALSAALTDAGFTVTAPETKSDESAPENG